jgi:bifunctional non-homologous end joining protein LigD
VKAEANLRAGRYTVRITSPDKVLFPDVGVTKLELARYYLGVGPLMVRYLKGRPILVQRFPDGIDRPGFIQQEAPDHVPPWVRRVTVPKVGGGSITHATVDNTASLVYLVNLNTVAVHAWLSRFDRPRQPDRLIFDLDPPDDEFGPVRETALALRKLLDDLGLRPLIMLTGSRGAHVTVPIRRGPDFDEVRRFADQVAARLVEAYPDLVTTEARVEARDGRLYIDTRRNAYGQTAVAPYSVRAKPGAPVAVPIDWSELDEPGLTSRRYNIRDIPARLARRGDPWAGTGRHAADLRRAWARLARPGR